LLSPIYLLIGSPDFFMNVLADNSNMTNIYFHYTAVITPFIFIAAIYGANNFLQSEKDFFKLVRNKLTKVNIDPSYFILSAIIIATIAATLYMAPLPWGHHRDLYPWQALPAKAQDVSLWAKYLEDENIKVSATGHIGPKFTSRRYYYHFANGYDRAQYIVVDKYDIDSGFQKEDKIKQYDRLQSDWRYIRIYDNNGIEVYKNISNLK